MRLRSWSKLEYLDPHAFLVGLAKIAESIPQSGVPYNVASLRTNQLKRHREARQCALFCYGMGHLVETMVRFAPAEEADVDFVAWFNKGDESHFVPIQMKELVPARVRADVSLQGEIDKLGKYVDSKDLCVVFHINREVSISPSELDVSRALIRELWLVGSSDAEGREWRLCGDLMSGQAQETCFRYPEP